MSTSSAWQISEATTFRFVWLSAVLVGFIFNILLHQLMPIIQRFLAQETDRVPRSRSWEGLTALVGILFGLMAMLQSIETRILVQFGARFRTLLYRLGSLGRSGHQYQRAQAIRLHIKAAQVCLVRLGEQRTP